jgi:hypothetical protein
MKITNVMGLPEALVRAVTREQHNKPGHVSVTTLLKGVKEIVLTQRHWDEVEIDVADMVNMIFGTAVHKILETEGENTFAEEFLCAELNGYTVTGRIDSYDMKEQVVDDYKTASIWKIIHKDFSDWKVQGQGYGWLLFRNGLKIKKARFTAMLKDYKKAEAERDSSYPQKPCVVYEFPIGESDIYEFQRFAAEKIDMLRDCKTKDDDSIPPCTPAERWAKEKTFAVMKDGRKSAIRVCQNKADAEAISLDNPGSFVVERPGLDTKCMRYCSVAPFCSYYRENYGKGE